MSDDDFDPCPIEGCDDERRPSDLMCRYHWHRVPKAIRDRVWRHWRARLAARVKGQADRAVIKLHQEACRDAIASVPKDES